MSDELMSGTGPEEWPGCSNDHWVRHSYLLNTKVESFAPPVILTRALHHHMELELSTDQVYQLLDISKTYHEKSSGIAIQFAKVTAELEAGCERTREQTEEISQQRANFFTEHERLIMTFYKQIDSVFSETQRHKARKLYDDQMRQTHTELGPSLAKVLAPALEVSVRD